MHTITLLKNLSSNPVERFHRTFSAVLRTRGPGVRPNWGVWLNAKCSCSTQQCTAVQECSSTGVTPNYAMFGCNATLPVDWVFPIVDLVFPKPSAEKRTIYNWAGNMKVERQRPKRV